MRTSSVTKPIYIAQTQPGFEVIAADEIANLEGAQIRSTHTIGDKAGIVIFTYPDDPADLLELRTIEDLFEQILYIPDLAPTFAALKQLTEATLNARTIEPALQRARQLKPGRGGQGKLRYRVVARQLGETHFRRVDAQIAVEKGIMQRPEHRWRLAEEGALEFWLTLAPGEALLMLRLSDDQQRHRSYKIEHIPASLRPAAAAALVHLTKPRAHDSFLDPMCGAGTILIERALAGRYEQLWGGDSDPSTLDVVRLNVGSRYQPITLQEWDARHLPLDAGSITAAAVNLPFGTRIGSPEENRTLYPATLRELARVLQPRARLVLLSGDAANLNEAIKRVSTIRPLNGFPVHILGHRARIVVIERL
ncbi:MAG: methyltransferase domain-containing protein [Roseiflexaceae bacterium]